MSRSRQILGVMRLELRKGLSFWRSAWLVCLAFAPTLITTVHALRDRSHDLSEEVLILGVMVQLFYVRFAVFFGCLGLSMRVLRGEVAEKTLHYVFLAPVSRSLLIVGKFLAAALVATVIFGTGVLATSLAMYGHSGPGRALLSQGPGLGHVGAYLLVTVLACLGYSAVFLGASLVFKNPVVPAMVLLLWETLNAALPLWLKRFAVTYYLKPLFPVQLPLARVGNLITVVAEPMAPLTAVAGLLAFTVLVVAYASYKIRTFEISYSSE
jgi:ABC-type transport system involved in multi-copper enzyme maturation permease subunit